MQATLDQELDIIERNSNGWSSLNYYDRTLLQRLGTCLESCLAVTSDNTFLNIIINRRPQAFDTFEYVAAYLFKQWYHQKHSLVVEQLNYLTIVGTFNRRLALTLQNDNDDIDQENEQTKNNLEHHKRVRELLFDNNKELFDILMKILPNMNKNEFDFIEMILPWYESYIFFEHSYIDSTLDEKFLYFNHQIIQCLNSNEYKQSILLIENNQTMIITVYHRFYLGICTMAMGIHVNCDENECDNAKFLLELYLSNYIIFINYILKQNQINTLNNLSCLTGIITYLINYTLIIDNNNNRQLLIYLFSLILHENIYMNICMNWSTYETILIDSIICYLIIYCFNNYLLIQYIIQIDNNYIKNLENLIEQAQLCGNRRISIMAQLFLLILISSTTNNDLSEKLFLSCLNYIQMSLQNIHSYHYNRIPMNMFFKSLIYIVKYDYIQEIIRHQYLNLFINVIINYENKNLYDNIIYYECTMITLNILWSLSFNENIKKILKQNEQNLFDIIQKINKTTNEMSVKQITCGLLYNLDQLDLSQHSIINDHNFGKTIGISYDPSDHKTVEMIEHELNKNGLRVWTIYDHMDDNFISSFISLMNNTQYLIVCLSDMYRLNNRCRTELLYATASGHQVLSWKVYTSTNNPDNDEQIRIHAIETLLQRVIPNDVENTQTILPSITDTEHINIHMERRSVLTNFSNRRRAKEIMSLENWTNTEVLAWCELINLPGFLKLITNFDGQSVIRLYEFCKQNSTETISLLNSDLHHICQQDHIPDIQISVHEFIRFQIEVEKLLSITSSRNSSISLSSSKIDIYKNRLKIKTCQNGSGQLIFVDHFNNKFNQCQSLLYVIDLKNERDYNELCRVGDIQHYYETSIRFEEKLFQRYCRAYGRLKQKLEHIWNISDDRKEILLTSILNRWAFWLDEIVQLLDRFINQLDNLQSFCQATKSFITEPSQLIKLGKYYAKNKKLSTEQHQLDFYPSFDNAEYLLRYHIDILTQRSTIVSQLNLTNEQQSNKSQIFFEKINFDNKNVQYVFGRLDQKYSILEKQNLLFSNNKLKQDIYLGKYQSIQPKNFLNIEYLTEDDCQSIYNKLVEQEFINKETGILLTNDLEILKFDNYQLYKERIISIINVRCLYQLEMLKLSIKSISI
ncbi:unnamed protein product [Rotaria sordida]|uniref:TIR domain-containing protein n=1 Tax=Rotaria sordida TaxID=392033 RepID=A0A815C5X6_9BILA|nr:unnamed protein product [Rotaria sordida]